jgi:hypothetical protein
MTLIMALPGGAPLGHVIGLVAVLHLCGGGGRMVSVVAAWVIMRVSRMGS